jgi:hypothetical protein
MNRRLYTAGLLILLGIGSANILLACGDKFLVTSRGTRFQRAAVAREPAAILIYMNQASELPKVLASLPIDATLTKVGYRSTTVATSDEFENALSRGGWDLVVVDIADALHASQGLRGDVAPVVLPVAFNVTAADLKQTGKQYPVVFKGPAKSQAFLLAIDEALAHRPKQRTKPTSRG